MSGTQSCGRFNSSASNPLEETESQFTVPFLASLPAHIRDSTDHEVKMLSGYSRKTHFAAVVTLTGVITLVSVGASAFESHRPEMSDLDLSAYSTAVGGTVTVPAITQGLGVELLRFRGDAFVRNMMRRHSCGKFGTNYVLVGLKVRHRVTTLIGIDLFCAALRADGTLGTPMYLPATAPTGGTSQQAVCRPGQAVVGYQGTF